MYKRQLYHCLRPLSPANRPIRRKYFHFSYSLFPPARLRPAPDVYKRQDLSASDLVNIGEWILGQDKNILFDSKEAMIAFYGETLAKDLSLIHI